MSIRVQATTTHPVGGWAHYAVQQEGNVQRIFMNGRLDGTGANDATALIITALGPEGTAFVKPTVPFRFADVRVYLGRVLPPALIQRAAETRTAYTMARYPVNLADPLAHGLTYWWPEPMQGIDRMSRNSTRYQPPTIDETETVYGRAGSAWDPLLGRLVSHIDTDIWNHNRLQTQIQHPAGDITPPVTGGDFTVMFWIGAVTVLDGSTSPINAREHATEPWHLMNFGDNKCCWFST